MTCANAAAAAFAAASAAAACAVASVSAGPGLTSRAFSSTTAFLPYTRKSTLITPMPVPPRRYWSGAGGTIRAMRVIRRDGEIHDVSGGWFRARWHFSFDDYQDPENDTFGAMRVFNDDRLIPGAVWPLHPHRDVEGLTYVVEGAFGHADNVGGAFGPLPAGSVQRMTLGSGAWHSEQNASKDELMRFIQIWILPDTPSLTPGVEQRVLTKQERS